MECLDDQHAADGVYVPKTDSLIKDFAKISDRLDKLTQRATLTHERNLLLESELRDIKASLADKPLAPAPALADPTST